MCEVANVERYSKHVLRVQSTMDVSVNVDCVVCDGEVGITWHHRLMVGA